MLALSIRQPFAELILRGIKRVEYRSRATRVIGERFWIYASKGPGVRGQGAGKKVWSEDLSTKGELPAWILELAEQVKLIPPGVKLPRGVIVGSAKLASCELLVAGSDQQQATNNYPLTTPLYAWHLTDVERATELRKPENHPQPVWFKPFGS
jgi:hypothetical protein